MVTQRLDTLIDLLTMSGDPPVLSMTERLWCRIERGAAASGAGLRARTDRIITRPGAPVWAGQYARREDELWIIDGVASDRRQGVVTATALAGMPGVYTWSSGGIGNVRCALRRRPAEGGRLEIAGSERLLEVPSIELTRPPARGDTVTAGGTTYTVTGVAAGLSEPGVTVLVVRT